LTYSATLDYLFAALPMYQRIGAAAFKKDLTNTLALCEAIGNPQHSIKTVHVAGTNGKGSSSHFLAAILQASGYKVGVYTSPHYRDFRERIKINGVYITENAIIDFVKQNKSHFERIEPSFFEMTVAMAFDYFAKQKVDIAIIEVGLGGRLDSTNIITPLLSLITNISLDHQEMLGDTLPLIAAEKAGIIKAGIPVVISEKQAETAPVFLAKAKEMRSKIVFAEDEWSILSLALEQKMEVTVLKSDLIMLPKAAQTILLDAAGEYQAKNLLGVLCAIDILKLHFKKINEKTILNGLENVKKLTNMIGRWQILNAKPLTIADSGHNEGGLRQTMTQLTDLYTQKHEKTSKTLLHFVLGVVKDKEIDKMLSFLPKNAQYYFAKADIPRGMPAAELQTKAAAHGLEGNTFESINAAFTAANTAADAHNDIIFVGGSCFTVAEVI
jgi:dihydrofolate synthase / folylpolyglutamate synthase